jgi:hypothetical protein
MGGREARELIGRSLLETEPASGQEVVLGDDLIIPGAVAGVGLRVMTNVAPERVDWLWPGRIPRGKLTVLEGDPGAGKSTLMLDVAARVSTGSPMPDGSPLGGAASVLLLTAEDGLADTVRPRLDAADANVARVLVWESVDDPIETDGRETVVVRPPSIPADLVHLERIIQRQSAALVVVDVLNAYLGGNVDGHRDQDVRRALMPLAKLAERTGAAIVVLRHLNKSGGANPLYRGGGSIGIGGAARAVLLAATDPDDDSRRILAVTKCSVAANAPALAYRLTPAEEHGCARVRWEGETEHTSSDLLARSHEGERSELDELAEVLRSLVGDEPVTVKAIKDELRRQGYTPDKRQLTRARDRAGLQTTPPSGFGGQRCFYRPASGDAPSTVSTVPTWENVASLASGDTHSERSPLERYGVGTPDDNGKRRMAEARLVGNPNALDDADRQRLSKRATADTPRDVRARQLTLGVGEVVDSRRS